MIFINLIKNIIFGIYRFFKNIIGFFVSFYEFLTTFVFKKKFRYNYKKENKIAQNYVKLFKNMPYDNIIILIGDNADVLYLFFTYIYKFFKEKNCDALKDILFVINKKNTALILDLICPEINYVNIKLEDDFVKYEEYIKSVLEKSFNVIDIKHIAFLFDDIINYCPTGFTHYFEIEYKQLHIEKENLTSFKELQIPQYIIDNAIDKAKKTKLNLDKFVFISPDSTYSKKYDDEFWTNLCLQIKELGYDIFLYKTEFDTQIKNLSYKTCKIDISEAVALAGLSKGIVSLRSPFNELCLQTPPPMFCLYNDFKDKFLEDGTDVYSAYYGYSLNKLPNINQEKLFEINMFEETNQDVIDKILSNLK